MAYQCPKGHQSTDSDYCSECGALIGQPRIAASEPVQVLDSNKPSGDSNASKEICPDCGTPRSQNARFCEVCRHDFQDNKTGVAEVIVASQKSAAPADKKEEVKQDKCPESQPSAQEDRVLNVPETDDPVVSEKLNVVICVDRDKADSWDGQSPIKPDSRERVFPLDLNENLLGRRSAGKGIYPEIEINDPGVSHRHLKFILQADGSFSVLELGSSNGTELNGEVLEPGVTTSVKAGDEFTLGIWTRLKIEAR